MQAEDTDVREPIELTDLPEASEANEEEEVDLFMKAGRGGARDPKDIMPCSSACISRIDVAVRVDSLSWLFFGVREGFREAFKDKVDELDASDDKDVFDGARVRRDRSDGDELDRGADAGMTTLDFRMEDLENFGALPARSGVGSAAGGAGGETESTQSPLSLVGMD
jgi:hypothetical protein